MSFSKESFPWEGRLKHLTRFVILAEAFRLNLLAEARIHSTLGFPPEFTPHLIRGWNDIFRVSLCYNVGHGAVVHSGERRICIAKVRGSNPLGSTRTNRTNNPKWLMLY